MSMSPATGFLITAGSPSDLVSQSLLLGHEQEGAYATVGADDDVRTRPSLPLPPRRRSAPVRERGLVLKELTLNRGHGGLLSHVPFLDRREEIVWLATSFDLSRHAVFVFPRKA